MNSLEQLLSGNDMKNRKNGSVSLLASEKKAPADTIEQAARQAPNQVSAQPAGGFSSVCGRNQIPSYDRNDIPENWESTVDRTAMVADYIETLKSIYKNVSIYECSLNGPDALKKYAASCGTGTYLVLSDEFIKKMASSAESFEKGKNLLNEVLKKLSAKARSGIGIGIGIGIGTYLDDTSATSWITVPKQNEQKNPFETQSNSILNLFKMMEEAQKEAEKRREAFKISYDKSILNSSGEIYSRIAKSSTVMAVKDAMITGEQKIYMLKLILSLGSEKDKQQARAAIAQLERAVASGSAKINHLNEEADMLRRQKRAEMQQQERKAEQIKAELKRKQAARHAREYSLIGRDSWFDYHEEWLTRKKIAAAERELSSCDTSVGASVGGEIGISTGGGAEVSVTTADVTVTAAMEISL